MLKDDKTYPYIKVTVGEAFPRIMLVRSMKKDKAKYFGPYTSSQSVRDIIDLSQKIYKIRNCSRSLPKETGNDRPVSVLSYGTVTRHHARLTSRRKDTVKMCGRCCISLAAISSR